MASGVVVDDSVERAYNEIRVHHTGSDEQEHLKLVLFRTSDDNKSIIVDQGSILRVKDLKGVEDVFKKVISMLPQDNCCYGLYDCHYETYESQKEDLVFFMWVPDTAPLKSKMIYASSKNAVKAKLSGLKLEWQVNDVSDAKDPSVLVDKLGGRGVVKSLEGKPVKA